MQRGHPLKTNSARVLDQVKEEIMDDDVFLSPSSIPASPIRGVPRKRPRLEALPNYQSRLRTTRLQHPAAPTLPYTPPPLLPPIRQGRGASLYLQATTASSWPTSITLKGEGSVMDESSGRDVRSSGPETDLFPQVNVGPEVQCTVPQWRWRADSSHPRCSPAREVSHDHLLWDPGISKVASDSEVDMYLEFACCAALPGGGRNKEYALHLLHLCHGNIHIGSKFLKQCFQFYYLLKKICPEDYKRLRLGRRRNRESDFEFDFSKLDIPSSDVELVSTSTESRLFLCEYQDCSASFNSRAALNSHIRIHGGGTCNRTPTPDKRLSATSAHHQYHHHHHHHHSDSAEEFPCKICGKIFNKVKSRSAHMKSHRPPNAERKKSKLEHSVGDQFSGRTFHRHP